MAVRAARIQATGARRASRKCRTSGPAIPIAGRRHSLVAELMRGLARCGVDLNLASTSPTKLIVGVSGGADSLALLLGCLVICRHRRTPSKLVPTVVHVHHHLRDSADDDAAFVKKLCADYAIECRIEHIEPARSTGNISANARHLRYEALQRVANELGSTCVAVAHHVEDQCETVLASLCRGAGLAGLSGMPWSRSLNKDVLLIRPMLGVRRSDCEAFCAAAAIQWCDDPSNADVSKSRNRLRHEVMPILNEIWPDAASRIAAAADVVSAANAALEQQLQDSFGPATTAEWSRAALQQLPISQLTAGLRRAAVHIAPDVAGNVTHRQLLQVAEAIQSGDRRPHQFSWAGDLRLKVTSRLVSLGKI